MAAAAAGAALLAAGGGTALASQNATATAARGTAVTETAPRCAIQQLAAALHGMQAGVGNRGMILTLTNVSGRACSVYGYPGLGLRSGAHKVLPSHTFWGSTYFDRDPGRSYLVLSPGESVSADVGYTVGNGTGHGVNATYLEVTPPNAYSHLTIRLRPVAPVSIFRGNLRVTAFSRHTVF